MFTFNSETNTYTTNNTAEDIEEAYKDLKCRQESDKDIQFSMSIMDGDKEVLHTSDASTMYKQYMDMSSSVSLEEGISNIGVGAFIAATILTKKSPGSTSATITNWSSIILTGGSTAIDFQQFVDNMNADTLTDLGITGLGFIPGIGTGVSLYSAGVKKGFVFLTTELAKAKVMLDKHPLEVLNAIYSFSTRH